MDDRIRRMIESYLPHPRDPSLQDGEYFFRRETEKGPRIIRVFALDILPLRDGTEYGIYQSRGGRLVRVDARGDGDPNRGVYMHDLYDNKEDCRDSTHYMYDEWENLRQVEQEERRF